MLALWASLTALAAGCGSNEEEPTTTADAGALEDALELDCEAPKFVACGGDLVGHWRVDTACLQAENALGDLALPQGCEVEAKAGDVSAEGDVRFDEDGSFEYSLRASGDIELTFSAQCLPADIGCSVLPQLVQYDRLSCTGVAALGCTCSSSLDGEPNAETGSWRVMSTRAVLEADGRPAAESVPFCREHGALLVYIPLDDLPNVGVTALLRRD